MPGDYEDEKIPGLTSSETQEYLSLQDRVEDAVAGEDADLSPAELRQFQQYNKKLMGYLEQQEQKVQGKKAMNDLILEHEDEHDADPDYERIEQENEDLELADDAAQVARDLVRQNAQYASRLLEEERGKRGPTDDLAQEHMERQSHEKEQERKEAYAIEHGHKQDPSEYEDREGHNAAEGMDAGVGPSQERQESALEAEQQDAYESRLRSEHGERTAQVAKKLDRLEDSLDEMGDTSDQQYVQRIREQVEEDGVESIRKTQLRKLKGLYGRAGSDGSHQSGSIREEYEQRESQIKDSSLMDEDEKEAELDSIQDAFHDALDQQDVVGEIMQAKRDQEDRSLGAKLKDRLGL